MDFRNCPQCGKLFKYVNRNLCPFCIGEEEKMFDVVRDYVRNNPNANVIEVSEATEVPQRIIMQFLRDGRLLSSADSALSLECHSCGEPITSGQYCDDCAQRMAKEFQGRFKQEEIPKKVETSETGQRMYTADLFGKKKR